MNNSSAHSETRSYQDPMAARLEAARKHQEAHEALFLPVQQVYSGCYARIDELTKEGSRYFLGTEGIVGSSLKLSVYGNDASQVYLEAADGRRLAHIGGELARRLAAQAAEGWQIRAFLATSFYQAKTKTGAIDLAILAWSSELSAGQAAALGTFAQHTADRLAHGDRAGLDLSQEQFIAILESEGAWFLTGSTKCPAPSKGTVVYKSRRSGTERISGYALSHRKGCNVLAIIFWVWLALALGALLWFFVLH